MGAVTWREDVQPILFRGFKSNPTPRIHEDVFTARRACGDTFLDKQPNKNYDYGNKNTSNANNII